MLTYIIRRILIGFVMLILITFGIYGLIRNMPGSPLTLQQAELDPGKQLRKEDYELMKSLYGLDKPIPVGYAHWLMNFAKLDLGASISRKKPVTSLIAERLPNTLLLSVPSIVLAYVLAIPLGLRATARSGTWEERITSLILYVLYSLPILVAALFLQILIAVRLEWLPLFGMRSTNFQELSYWGQVWDVIRHAILPVICLTYGSLAYDSRFIKSNMEEVIRQDYIRTARSKGASQFSIIFHHAFRNTLIPLVTLLGLTLPGLLSGAVILEQIFNWPGMGNLFFDSISERDYPTIMGVTLMLSVLTLAGQLLADVLYAFVDPRVSLW